MNPSKIGIDPSLVKNVKRILIKRYPNGRYKSEESVIRFIRKASRFSRQTGDSGASKDSKQVFGQLRNRVVARDALYEILGIDSSNELVTQDELDEILENATLDVSDEINFNPDEFKYYIAGEMQYIFSDQAHRVKTEIDKFQAVDNSDSKETRVFGIITKTKESAHAR
ncbi:MAG: hypothetical protein Q9M91_04135 [Candidatus Dojkabacteria bacterium]|nr:hypothetical protein [Candidatus Dojkabacteria bacterium]MDQ7021003.1 hypothetical protein [Candidatus Dojkabacteria bacterium]